MIPEIVKALIEEVIFYERVALRLEMNIDNKHSPLCRKFNLHCSDGLGNNCPIGSCTDSPYNDIYESSLKGNNLTYITTETWDHIERYIEFLILLLPTNHQKEFEV